MSFQKILVPIDFSEHSSAAFETAVDIAEKYGATIQVLHCYPIQPGSVSPYGIVYPTSFYTDLREAASAKMTEWLAAVAPKGLEVGSILSSEAPSVAISQSAEEGGFDLIVMGTRGLGGIKHVMLGSVAERTVRIAPCPVLTVRAS